MVVKFPHQCPNCRDPFNIHIKVEKESEGPVLSSGVDTVGDKPIRFYIRKVTQRKECEVCGHVWTDTGLEDIPEEADLDPIND